MNQCILTVTQDGKLYACGEATNGRLGLGINSGNVAIPRQLTYLSQYVIKKVAVHSGKLMMVNVVCFSEPSLCFACVYVCVCVCV